MRRHLAAGRSARSAAVFRALEPAADRDCGRLQSPRPHRDPHREAPRGRVATAATEAHPPDPLAHVERGPRSAYGTEPRSGRSRAQSLPTQVRQASRGSRAPEAARLPTVSLASPVVSMPNSILRPEPRPHPNLARSGLRRRSQFLGRLARRRSWRVALARWGKSNRQRNSADPRQARERCSHRGRQPAPMPGQERTRSQRDRCAQPRSPRAGPRARAAGWAEQPATDPKARARASAQPNAEARTAPHAARGEEGCGTPGSASVRRRSQPIAHRRRNPARSRRNVLHVPAGKPPHRDREW